MKDVTHSLTKIEAPGFAIIQPYILRRGSGSEIIPVWLEWSDQCPPNLTTVVLKQRPRFQSLEEYRSLAVIKLTGNWHTYASVADIIPDGEVIFAKVFGGCMWGMIPSDEPKPET